MVRTLQSNATRNDDLEFVQRGVAGLGFRVIVFWCALVGFLPLVATVVIYISFLGLNESEEKLFSWDKEMRYVY